MRWRKRETLKKSGLPTENKLASCHQSFGTELVSEEKNTSHFIFLWGILESWGSSSFLNTVTFINQANCFRAFYSFSGSINPICWESYSSLLFWLESISTGYRHALYMCFFSTLYILGKCLLHRKGLDCPNGAITLSSGHNPK